MEAHFPDPAATNDPAASETQTPEAPAPEIPPRAALGDTPPHDRAPLVTDAAGTPVPQVTPDQLEQLIELQKEMRQEISAAREEAAQARAEARRAATPPGPPAAALDSETLRKNRLSELAEHEFYCPGCGATYDYPQKCEGRPEAPHQKIEVVSTNEVRNAPDPKEVDKYRDWERSHTAAPDTDIPSLRRAGVL